MPVLPIARRPRSAADEAQPPPAANIGGTGGKGTTGAGHAALRLDIQGLRAVAVSLVALSHAGVTQVAGGYIGVDVFFVISGFLITALMLREHAKEGRIGLGRFYARRALRLLPASTLVVMATLAGSWLFLGPLRFADYAKDAIASAWYVVNFRLAETGTDYFNTDVPPSPFQHFWSLAVEEQFYLIWPILLIVALKVFRRRVLLGIPLFVLAAASFAVNLHLTETSPAWAYFGSQGRIWELAVGALLALAAHRLHEIPQAIAAVLSWAGLAAIAYGAVVFDDSTVFPGYNAVVPVIGAAAVLACGSAGGRYGAGALLSLRPAVWVGGISYAWYLWHWPLILLVPAAAGFGEHGRLRLAAALCGIPLAWLTLRLVENPMRFHRALKTRTGRGLTVGLSLSAVAALAAVVAAQFPPGLASGSAHQDTRETLDGASDPQAALTRLLGERIDKLPSNLSPSMHDVAYKRTAVVTDDCALTTFDVVQTQPCLYGDTKGEHSVVLFGDSHIAQWFPAMDAIAKKYHWRLYVFTKNSCKVSQITIEGNPGQPYATCDTWRDVSIEKIRKMQPELVITSSSQSAKLWGDGDIAEVWGKGQAETYRMLQQGRTRVLTLLDSPWPKSNAVDCAVAHPDDLAACARDRSEADRNPAVTKAILAAAEAQHVATIDPYDWICAPSGNCPIVVGNTMVYRDYGHLADAYVEALTPLVEDRLLNLFGADLSKHP
ncbi:acyltransferase family protein [Streptomyces sp. NPDC020403]|uniref:acyltransferase family protein n=1 Tax=unclassified Streptomyces TaxID=2593676 RepID=UPI00340A9D83